MNKEDFIKQVKDLAVDFWSMNLHNGTFEERLTKLIYEREKAIDYAHSSLLLKEKKKLNFDDYTPIMTSKECSNYDPPNDKPTGFRS